MARGIDDVDLRPFPENRRRSRGDRDPSLLLLLHPVHRGGTFVHFAHFVQAARVIEDAFCGRRLTGIDVGHDADIADVFKLLICWSCHNRFLPLPLVMGESFIGFGHAVGVVFLLNRGALVVEAISEFSRASPSSMERPSFGARVGDDPSHRHGNAAVGRDFNGHLIGCAADAARFHFERRFRIFQELAQTLLAGFLP